MSYISYKLYRMLRIPALIILGVEGLVLGCGMFNLGACFLAMLFGLVPFDMQDQFNQQMQQQLNNHMF